MPRKRKSKKKGNPYLSLVSGNPDSEFIPIVEACYNHYSENESSDWARFFKSYCSGMGNENLRNVFGYYPHFSRNPFHLMAEYAIRDSKVEIYAEKPYKAVIELVTKKSPFSGMGIDFDATIMVTFNYGKASRTWKKERIRRFRVLPLIKKSDIKECMEKVEKIIIGLMKICERKSVRRTPWEVNISKIPSWEEIVAIVERKS